jgi:hypothetical protein
MAERELSAFFNAITQLFGSEQADLSAEDWSHELIEIDSLPTSAREWRVITAKVSTRLPGGVNASSPSSLSAEFTNAEEMKMRVLVTGAAGFVGTAVAES